ncbi:MAG: hypothetical protein OEY87_05800 [Gammaproteobacteria bacterium]|nr:hypothetical protein [Gammaproteobacteria bacterium]MDH5735620.1 hypothetical protein [Gammaproteobacteria bacterium]
MHIRITTDPISLNEVINPESHPCIYDGNGQDGLEIYFENETNRDEFLAWGHEQDNDDMIVLMGNDSADYVAEG